LLGPCATTTSITVAINTTTTATTTNDPFYAHFPVPLTAPVLIVKVTTTITLPGNLIRRKGKAPDRTAGTISGPGGILASRPGRPFGFSNPGGPFVPSRIFSSSSIVAPRPSVQDLLFGPAPSSTQAPITTQGILMSLIAGLSTFPSGSANPFAGPADRLVEIARL
jgi:hypothetical protein